MHKEFPWNLPETANPTPGNRSLSAKRRQKLRPGQKLQALWPGPATNTSCPVIAARQARQSPAPTIIPDAARPHCQQSDAKSLSLSSGVLTELHLDSLLTNVLAGVECRDRRIVHGSLKSAGNADVHGHNVS